MLVRIAGGSLASEEQCKLVSSIGELYLAATGPHVLDGGEAASFAAARAAARLAATLAGSASDPRSSSASAVFSGADPRNTILLAD